MLNSSKWVQRSCVPSSMHGRSVAGVLARQFHNPQLPSPGRPLRVLDRQLQTRGRVTSSLHGKALGELKLWVPSCNSHLSGESGKTAAGKAASGQTPHSGRDGRYGAIPWSGLSPYKKSRIHKKHAYRPRARAISAVLSKTLARRRYPAQPSLHSDIYHGPGASANRKPLLSERYSYTRFDDRALVYLVQDKETHGPQPTAFIRPARFCLSWYPAFAKVHAYRLPQWSTAHVKRIRWRFLFEKVLRRRSRAPARIGSQGIIIEAWESLSPRQKQRYWMSALLYSLYKQPLYAAELLLSILHQDPHLIPGHVAKDCVAMVTEQLIDTQVAAQQNHPRLSAKSARLCLDLVHKFLELRTRSSDAGELLSYRTMSSFIQHLDGEELHDLVSRLLSSKSYISPRLLCLLSLAFTAHGKIQPAMEMLDLLPQLTISSPRTVTACTKILQAVIVADVDYKVRTNILTHMLELGVVPDSRMRDFIILNASAAGDRDTAWTSHEIAINRGLAPTATTYAFLLMQKDGADLQAISRIHRAASGIPRILPKSPPLASAMVHAVARAFASRHPQSRYRYMLAMYRDLYDLQPLRDVGIVQDSVQGSSRKPIRPESRILSLMVSTWILAQEDVGTIKYVYYRWLAHAENGSSRMALTAEDNFVANTFMLRFSRFGDVEMCREILQKLLQTRPVIWSQIDGALASRRGRQPRTKTLSKPDATTWNIFLKSLLDNGHERAAWEVHDIMKAISCEPDESTYKTMLDHFIRKQDLESLAQTLTLRQKAGFELDAWTERAMSSTNEKERLVQAFTNASISKHEADDENSSLEDDVAGAELIPEGGRGSLGFLAREQDKVSDGHWSYNDYKLMNQTWQKKSAVLGPGIAGRKHVHSQR